MKKRTPGNILFGTIEQDPYLQELYNNILYNYSVKLFNIKKEPKDINVEDALRFADLLSKSNHLKKGEQHKIFAQEIVALLKYLYPNRPAVKHYLGSVLSNIGNYLGKLNQAPSYKSENFLDRIYSEFAEDSMVIPAEPNSKFLRSQKYVYDKLSTSSFLSYSGPTSMGKSFIMRMFIKEKIMNDELLNFALIVPTKALINEVSHKINNDLKELLASKDYKIVTSPGSIFLNKPHNFIFVLTPERLLYLMISYPDINIKYLFIDEAHKISSKDSRSPFYYKTIDELSRKKPKPHIIFASPNIPNPQIYLKLLPFSNISDIGDNALSTKFSPVSQMKYLIDYPTKKIYLYNKYTNECSLLTTIRSEPGVNIIRVIDHIGKGRKNLIYCNSRNKAIELAQSFAERKPILSQNKELMKLASDVSSEIHSDCYLATLIQKGIGYHVGFLPTTIRMRIEDLYKSGNITTLFCTSTLVEGVNLPADNLFITSYQNGRSTMSDVDFANLVGRVGRIDVNLYGNVFLTRMIDNKDNKIEQFEAFLKGEVLEQELSIELELTRTQKQKIVDCLKQGSMELLKYPKSQTIENYELMRKFAIILVKDILKGTESAVKKKFAEQLNIDDEQQIREAFNKHKDMLDDDINISLDQTVGIVEAIKNGLCYPELDENGYISHNELLSFLKKLSNIFKWRRYERATIGKLCKNFENNHQCGNTPACYYCRNRDPYKQLSFYAVVLSKWIQGRGLSWIIKDAINYKYIHPKNAIVLPDQSMVDFDNSIEHKNIVIAETLDIIENIILFKMSNYFLKFSTEYKKINGPNSLKKDWYEYVEYGTTNDLSIFFQKSGLLREVVNFIKDNDYYVKVSDGEYKIKKSIMQCEKENVLREINDLFYNAPELFVDL